ncbi:MAG: ABC transporter substrate-binding protein [Chloroflexota bacterium]|nr:ABC transporter substrate-binding protein [Chloroflexota bacterium]
MTTRTKLGPPSPWIVTGDALRQEIERSNLNRRALLRRGLLLGLGGPAAAIASRRGVRAAPPRQLDVKGGDGTLIVSVAGEPLSFNPNLHLDATGFVVACNIFSMLVTLDGEYNLLPDLARRWEVAADGLTVTFDLVRRVEWHDGEPVTAADVKYSLEAIMADESAPANSILDPIASVDAADDTTVVLNLSAPSASLVGSLGWAGTFILPAHIYEGTDWTTNEANQAPVGSGPFRFASYTPAASIDLLTNYDYYGDGPHVDRLIFQIIPDAETAVQALRNGEIDLVYSPPVPMSRIPELRQTSGIMVGEQMLPGVFVLGFNLEAGPTSNLDVRRALAQAIDRQQILEVALGGASDAATSFSSLGITPGSTSGPTDGPTAPALDRDAAAGLEAAGYPVVDDTRFRLVLPYSTGSPAPAAIAAVIGEQLGAINVETELVALAPGAWEERMRTGEFDLGVIDGSSGPATPRALVGTGGSGNYWRFSDPAVDALLDEADALLDEDERAGVDRAFQEILAEWLPILPLASVVAFYPYTERATGFAFAGARGEVGLHRFNLTELDAI